MAKNRYDFSFDWPGWGLTISRAIDPKIDSSICFRPKLSKNAYKTVLKVPRQHYRIIITFNWVERLIMRLIGIK